MRYTIGYHQDEYKQKIPQVIISNPKWEKPRIIDTTEKLPPLPIRKEDIETAKQYLQEIEKDIYGIKTKRKELTLLLKQVPKILDDIDDFEEEYEGLKELIPDLSSTQQEIVEKAYEDKKRDYRRQLNNKIKEINTKLTEIGG